MKTTTAKKMVGILAAVLLVAFSGPVAFAAPPGPGVGVDVVLEQWKTTGSCYNCNLSNKTLPKPTGSDGKKTLENAILTGATFETGVDLSGYNLVGATCNGTIFKGNKLNGAKVDKASFQGAKFQKNTDAAGVLHTTDISQLTLADPNNVQAINFASSDMSDAKKPATGKFHKNVNLGESIWTKADKCDKEGSLGGCKQVTKCPPAKLGWLKVDGTCE